MTLTRSTVRDNDLGIDIDLDIGSPGGMTLDHSWVRDNSAIGINNDSNALLVKDSVIADNGAQGIENSQQKATTVLRSTIRGNGGAGIRNSGSLLVVDSVLRDNQGGGIESYAYVTMRGSVVAGNSSPGNGGGLLLAALGPGGQGDISDSVIEGNHAGSLGGGIYGWGSGVNLDLDRVVIKDNIAINEGGGIFEAGVDGGHASLTDVTFSNNTPNDCTGC